jgi:hypothetical protein
VENNLIRFMALRNRLSSHSIGCLGGRRGKKTEKKEKRQRLWEIKNILFALLNPPYIDLILVAV